MRLFNPNGEEVNCDKDQVELLLEHGYTREKKEDKKDGFVELSEAEYSKLSVPKKEQYNKAKEKHEASLKTK